MKLLKMLLLAVVVLGVALVGGSLFLPATTHVERSATIDAPPPEAATPPHAHPPQEAS